MAPDQGCCCILDCWNDKNTWFAAADTERGIGVIGGGADDPVVAAGAALGSESLVRAATATAKSWV